MQSRISSSRIRRNFRLAAILCLAAMLLALAVAGLAKSALDENPGASFSTSPASLPDVARRQAGRSSDGLWERIAPSKTAELERLTSTQASVSLRLNRDVLKRLLDQAPLEFTDEETSRVLMTVPSPDGRFDRFWIEESPIMAPELAAKFPEIKTYRGQGIDDPTATVRFDVMPSGFHAQILSASETVYIDPDTQATDNDRYHSYLKRHLSQHSSFECLAGAGEKDGGVSVAAGQMAMPLVSFSNGAALRTYRLALAATGEYTIAAGGTVAAAMARMTTTLNRINGIYERELALRMTLVANNDLLIYTDPATDPYTNNTPGDMMGENQTNLDAVIGNPNYDQGHVFGTGPGGTAPVRSTCKMAFKGQGVTGLPNPTGDPFDVDFAAHEMGHQHGGLHTFNTTTGSCSGFRNMVSAFEPGSGSTPMSYVGTCAPNNLQKNANDYFHVRTLEEIVNYMNGDGACAAQTATGNTPPTVNAGASFTIPRNTPFALTASGSDGNGDALVYNWEEYDLGPLAPPEGDADGSARPLFRSYPATANPTRTFPSLQYILNNANVPPATYDCGMPNPCITGESLPNITRTMNFQATVRDHRAGGGGIASAQMQVNVTAAAGPFLVTQPNTAVSWTGGTLQTVLWDVANTTAAPVSAATANILLSTDGGNTFPTVLATGTPNDGTQDITVPNVSTTTARIKVEAAGNIFFDISGANFTITPGATPTPTPSPSPSPSPTPSSTVRLEQTTYTKQEDCTSVTVTVSREGSTSGAFTVDFETADGTASERRDYTTALGTLRFAAGETTKTVDLLITEDSLTEGPEAFSFTLNNPSGASLGTPSTATVTISDDPSEPATNAIDDSTNHVCQGYHDFLNRQPDAAGLAFWVDQIESCGADLQCREVRRINVSAANFLSIEFQNTAFLVERFYKVAYGDAVGTSTQGGPHSLAVPIIRFREFIKDTQRIREGLVVLQSGWEAVLESNKQLYASDFVATSRFITVLPTTMTPAEFVDRINQNAGSVLSASERTTAINLFSGAGNTTNTTARAQAVRQVAEDPDLITAEFNRTFVKDEYFGYLRRNPDDPNDTDYTGFDFWLSKLIQFNGNYINAEMVKGFLQSSEYRQRFGP